MNRVRVLYVTYDGVLEPLGQSQVLSYLERLSHQFSITLLSFEKREDIDNRARMDALRSRLDALGIEWVALKYHKQPPIVSTAWDIVQGIRRARRIARTKPPDIVHARSYVPSVIALAIASATGARFLFDMRAFWVDEKVESGGWKRGGLVYRGAKAFERRFLDRADAIVSLTYEGVRHLPDLGFRPERGIPIEVIPTCVDVRRFVPGPKDTGRLAALGLRGGPVAGCVGTLSNRYFREDTIRYLAYLAHAIPGLQILIITRDDHERLRRDAAAAGLDLHRLVLVSADFAEMPDLVRLIDVGVFFMKPFFSQKGSAATKMAEFLACGIPVVVNDGVADSSAIVQKERVGIVMRDTSPQSFEQSLPAVRALFGDKDASKRCREVAVRLFDVEAGAERYGTLYRTLGGKRS